MYKLLSIVKSNKKEKKLVATFLNLDTKKEKKVHFGASGYEDYTIHKDKARRDRYRLRHKKDLKTNDPTKPGYLSYYILWNKPTLKESIEDYKKKFKL